MQRNISFEAVDGDLLIIRDIEHIYIEFAFDKKLAVFNVCFGYTRSHNDIINRGDLRKLFIGRNQFGDGILIFVCANNVIKGESVIYRVGVTAGTETIFHYFYLICTV